MFSSFPKNLAAHVGEWSLAHRTEVASRLGATDAEVDTIVDSLCEADTTTLFEIFSDRVTDDLWRLLYKERFSYLYRRLELLPIDGARAWHRSVQEEDLYPPGEYVYTFWDKLYSSTAKMWQNESHMYLFDRLLHGADTVSSDDSETFARQYPLVTLLCTTVSKAAKHLLVSVDSRDYIHVNWSIEEKIAINEKITIGCTISSFLLEDEDVPPTSRDLLDLAVRQKDASFAQRVLSNQRYMSHYLTRESNCCKMCIDEALYTAVQMKATEIVALLLEDGRANPAYGGCICLKEALKSDDKALVQLLLSDKRVTSSSGYQEITTANNLIQAVRDDQIGYIRTFIKDLSSKLCTTLLFEAVKQERVEIVKFLLQNSTADPTEVLEVATNPDIVEVLVRDSRADPRSGGSRVLQTMVNCNFAGAVRLLLEDGRADPGKVTHLPRSTYENCAEKHTIVALLLSSERFNPSVFKNKILKFLIIENDKNLVEFLLSDRRSELDLNKLLLCAIRINNIEIFSLLLSDKRAEPHRGRILQYAARWRRTKIVKILLEDGRADPCDDGGKAFKIALGAKKWKMVNLFIADKRIAKVWKSYADMNLDLALLV